MLTNTIVEICSRNMFDALNQCATAARLMVVVVIVVVVVVVVELLVVVVVVVVVVVEVRIYFAISRIWDICIQKIFTIKQNEI